MTDTLTWSQAIALSDVPEVHEALTTFGHDNTGDNAVCLVMAIYRAIQPAQAAQSETCPTCGESEPYSGACGTSASDMRALCKRRAQAAQTHATVTGGVILITPESRWVAASFDRVQFEFPQEFACASNVFVCCQFERCDGLPPNIMEWAKACMFVNTLQTVAWVGGKDNFIDNDGLRPMGPGQDETPAAGLTVISGPDAHGNTVEATRRPLFVGAPEGTYVGPSHVFDTLAGDRVKTAALALLTTLPSPGSRDWPSYYAQAEVLALRDVLGLPS